MQEPAASGPLPADPSPAGLDLGRLGSHLDLVAPGLVAGPLRGRLLAGGRSNLTYLVDDGTNRWVVRRPPLGHVLATAHDMAREYRVMSALRGSPVPVPATVLLCTDAAVLGAPFYLMRYVEGTVLREPSDVDDLSGAQLSSLALALVETLAELHTLTPAAVGLADFGRPDGFNHRQVRRWQRQLESSRCREIPGIDELYRRLAVDVPEVADGGAIVHGDFRLDNAVVGADAAIRAVLDWEMSTIGDPLGDLALFLVYAGFAMDVTGGDPRSLASLPGWPPQRELIIRYAERRSIVVDDLRWYRAFATFKLAVILEGVHFRYLRGQTVGPGFDRIGDRVEPVVADGIAILGAT